MESTVRFYKDLGLDSSYRFTRDFLNVASRDTWFARQPYTEMRCNYDKVRNNLKVETDFETASEWSYATVDTGSFTWFCFIASVEVVNDRTVSMNLTVDVFQTYYGRWSLGESFVVRKHMDRWSPTSDKPAMALYPHETADGFQTVPQKTDSFIELDINAYDMLCVTGVRTVNESTSIVMLSVPWTDTAVATADGKPFYTPDELVSGKIGDIISGMTVDSVVGAYVIRVNSIKDDSGFKTYSWAVGAIQNSGEKAYYLRSIGGYRRGEAWSFFTKTLSNPVKPSNGSAKSEDHEPMMFIQPMTAWYIMGPDVQVLAEISENAVLSGDVQFSISNLMTASGGVTRVAYGVSGTAQHSMYEGSATDSCVDVPAVPIDVPSNNWVTYANTQRNTDRELMNLNVQQNAVNNIVGAVQGGILGGGLLGPAGAIAGLATGLVSTGIGAYYGTKEQETKEKGIRNLPNGLKLNSGSGYAYASYTLAPLLVKAVADDATRKAFFDKIYRFGYNVNRVMTPDIRSRTLFDYIQTQGAQIRGNMPEDVRSDIMSVFDNGTTIVHDGADIYDALYANTENLERSLI